MHADLLRGHEGVEGKIDGLVITVWENPTPPVRSGSHGDDLQINWKERKHWVCE